MRLSRPEIKPVQHEQTGNVHRVVVSSKDGGNQVIVTIDFEDGSGTIEVREWEEPARAHPYPLVLAPHGTPPQRWHYPEETATLRAEAERARKAGRS